MARRRGAKARGRSRSRSRSRKGRGVRKGGRSRAGGFLSFVRSMRSLFPRHTPTQLKQDSKALWREMTGEDRSMYTSRAKMACGPGRMGRRMGRRRSRSRSRRRSRSRSRSRSRRSRRPG